MSANPILTTESTGSCCGLFLYSKGTRHNPKCALYEKVTFEPEVAVAPAPETPLREMYGEQVRLPHNAVMGAEMLHPDITEGNHGGNPESAEANKRTNKGADSERLAAWYRARGARGGYMELAATELKMRHQTVSARQSDLKRLGVLFKTTQRTRTSSGAQAGVYVHVDFMTAVPLASEQYRKKQGGA